MTKTYRTMKTAQMISKRGLRYREPFVSTARCLASQMSLEYYREVRDGNADGSPDTHILLQLIRNHVVRSLLEWEPLHAIGRLSTHPTSRPLAPATLANQTDGSTYQCDGLGRVDLHLDVVHWRCHTVVCACAFASEGTSSPGTGSGKQVRRARGRWLE